MDSLTGLAKATCCLSVPEGPGSIEGNMGTQSRIRLLTKLALSQPSSAI